MEHILHRANHQPRNNQDPIIYILYGASTNNENNTYFNKNIGGSVTFDAPPL